jgi:hypothetical protein
MKKRTSVQLWQDTITPIAEYCAKTRGAKTAILKRMNTATPPSGGSPWNRQQVESYLNIDPAMRQEPRLGAGLALMQAANYVLLANAVSKIPKGGAK